MLVDGGRITLNKNQIDAIDFEEFSQLIEDVTEDSEKISINSKIAIPIISISRKYSGNEDIPIYTEDNIYIGTLCFCKKLNDNREIEQLTEWQWVAYITDVELDDFYIRKINFKFDYLIIETEKYTEYIENFYDTAPIWGKFSHEDTLPTNYNSITEKIVAISNLHFPTPFHKNGAERSIAEPYAFERFLKQYHLLELLFDYDIVNQIKNIPDDLKGIGKILNDYKRDETIRLKSVIERRCNTQNQIDKIILAMRKITEYENKGEEIFYEFGKETNPLKLEEYKHILRIDFDRNECSKEIKRMKKEGSFDKILLDTAVYWIYRLRCSIAHNKIGEYIMTNDDEKFVADFGEPLLNEVIIQCLKRESV